uniref:Uncharacterized protein n=1 Tax=Arundo donax TaxID=35708 RepID=A0A0A9B697_ARUDO
MAMKNQSEEILSLKKSSRASRNLCRQLLCFTQAKVNVAL